MSFVSRIWSLFFVPNVTIHSRLQKDKRFVVLARKKLLSFCNLPAVKQELLTT